MIRQESLVRIVPYALYMAFLVADPLLVRLLPEGFDARWLYAVRITSVAAMLVILWRGYDELRKAPAPSAAAWAWGLIGGAGVFLLWIRLDFPPLVIGEAGGFDPRSAGRMNWPLAVTRVAGAALVVPVMEELFWRSFLLRWLARPAFLDVDPKAAGWKPVLISAALFATEHNLWFAGLLAGIVYGWLYVRTGNLWVPVLGHAVTNALLGAWVLWTGSWGFW